MKSQTLLSLLAAALAAAQNSGDVSLTDALASKEDTLSQLGDLLKTQPDLVETLSQAQNITILAPSNDALKELLGNEEVAKMIAADPGLVAALLSYHVLNGTYYADDIMEKPSFVHTLLMNSTYSNVTDGQVVEVMKSDDSVQIISGLRMESEVTEANLNFTGGVIHIINKVLTLPMGIAPTALAANLTALVGAVTEADLVEPLSAAKDVTVFAPSNAAFAAIGSAAGDLSKEDLAKILQYHVVTDGVFYSTDVPEEGEVGTLADSDVTVRMQDGNVYVNGAKVIVPDVLFAGGVIHVIDQVLNPDNADQEPNASSVTPAFSGASTASDGMVPFTSAVANATPTMSDSENLKPEETGRQGSGQGGSGGDNSGDGEDSEGGDGESSGARFTAAAALGAFVAGGVFLVNLM